MNKKGIYTVGPQPNYTQIFAYGLQTYPISPGSYAMSGASGVSIPEGLEIASVTPMDTPNPLKGLLEDLL